MGKQKKVLIIAENSRKGKRIANFLTGKKKEGVKVKLVSSREKIFKNIFEFAPKIVIIDVTSSQNYNGYEICNIIKSNFMMPILAITEGDNISSHIRAKQEGADACVMMDSLKNHLPFLINALLK